MAAIHCRPAQACGDEQATEQYEVVAGARRQAALNMLAKEKRASEEVMIRAASWEVKRYPCIAGIVPSLAELEAAASWLERNQLADHVRLLRMAGAGRDGCNDGCTLPALSAASCSTRRTLVDGSGRFPFRRSSYDHGAQGRQGCRRHREAAHARRRTWHSCKLVRQTVQGVRGDMFHVR